MFFFNLKEQIKTFPDPAREDSDQKRKSCRAGGIKERKKEEKKMNQENEKIAKYPFGRQEKKTKKYRGEMLGRFCKGPHANTHLGHLLSVGLGVEGGFCQQHGMLFRGDSEFIVEGVVPNLLHVIPVGDNAMFNGILQGQDASLALRLVSNIAVFLAHPNHHTLWREENQDFEIK